MKIGYLIAGFVFLSNPNIGVIDVLPDFIGFFLINRAIGVSKLFSPDLKDSARYCVILSVVSILKTLCIPLLFQELRSFPIVLSFSFALIECVLLLLFTGKLFEGLFYIGIRYDIPAVFNGGKQEFSSSAGRRKVEKGTLIKRTVFVFFVFRSLISVLPDLSDLQLTSDSETGLVFSDLNVLANMTVVVLGLIAALVLLCKAIPYFRSVSNDGGLTFFNEKCGALLSKPLFIKKLKTRRIIVLLCFALAISAFVSIDGLIIPGLLPAIIVIITAFEMRSFNKKAVLAVIPALLTLPVSAFNFVSRYRYYIEMHNSPEASLWSPLSGAIYDKIVMFNCIERVLLLMSLLVIFATFFNIIKGDFNHLSADPQLDKFESESIASITRKYLIWTVIGLPVYLLTAFEPLLLLEIDFVTVILTVASVVWIVIMIILFSDMFRRYYHLSPIEEI